jgi:hypothetical protein
MDAVLAPVIDVARPLRKHVSVVGTFLIGSYASGAQDEASDIDLLTVVPDDADRTARRAVRRLVGSDHEHNVEHRLIRRSALRNLVERRTVFGAHVATTGTILFDRDGTLAAFQRDFPTNEPVLERADGLRARFAPYQSLRWCNGRYLFCLADLYAIGRSAAILGLAQRGVFDFERRTVFDRLAGLYPSLSADVTRPIADAAPFYLLVRRGLGSYEELPYDPVECHEKARAVRDACRAILTTVE